MSECVPQNVPDEEAFNANTCQMTGVCHNAGIVVWVSAVRQGSEWSTRSNSLKDVIRLNLMNLERFSTLVGRIYEAAYDRKRRKEWLESVCLAAHADAIALAVREADRTFRLLDVAGLAPKAADEYNTHWWLYDEMRHAPEGAPVQSIYTASASEYWTRFLLPAAIRSQALTGSSSGDRLALVTWYRHFSPAAHDAFSALSCLLPHVSSVLKRQEANVTDQSAGDATRADAVMNALGVPLVLASADGSLLLVNNAARELASVRDGFAFASDGPVGASTRQTDLLREAIRHAATEGGVRRIRLLRASGRRPYEVTIASLQSRANEKPVRRALLWVRVPEVQVVTPETLSGLHGLTSVEARVCALMLEGHAAADIAAELALSVQTVRWYTRQLYSRFEVRTQAQLMRALAGSGLLPLVSS